MMQSRVELLAPTIKLLCMAVGVNNPHWIKAWALKLFMVEFPELNREINDTYLWQIPISHVSIDLNM